MFHVHCCCLPSRSTALIVAQSSTAVRNTNVVQRTNANMTTVTCRATTVTVTSVGLNEDSSPDAVAATSSQLRGRKIVLGACSDLRRTSSRDGLHPSRAYGELLCARAAMHDAPEPILEYITPAPVRIAAIAVIAAPAPEAEHIAPAPAEITGPAPVVEYIPPTPAVSHAAPAPTGYAAAAPVVEYVCQHRASNQLPSNAQVLSPLQHRKR